MKSGKRVCGGTFVTAMDRKAFRSPSRSVFPAPKVTATALPCSNARPSVSTFLCIITICFFSAWALVFLSYREEKIIGTLQVLGLEAYFASVILRLAECMVTIIIMGAIAALCKVISSQESSYETKIEAARREKTMFPLVSACQPPQSNMMNANAVTAMKTVKQDNSSFAKGPRQMSPTGPLVPSHLPAPKTARGCNVPGLGARLERYLGLECTSSAGLSVSNTPPSMNSPMSINQGSSPYRHQASPEAFSSPWDKENLCLASEVRNETELEEFLTKLDTKLVESVGNTVVALQENMSSPNTMQGTKGESPGMANVPGTRLSTLQSAAVRNLTMSPGRQKSGVSPKKEGDFPLPMTIEQAVEGFCRLGIYPQVEVWRDNLRQWFSQSLLKPMVQKIETSHLQVMAAAAKLGISIHVTPLGGDNQEINGGAPAASEGSTLEWLTTFSPDEDALMHQFRAALVNIRDATSSPQRTAFGLKAPQQGDAIHAILLQDCLDAVTEHQRLKALMKGEWVKGLLPQSSVRSGYTVQRIKELAEGTCLKRYELVGSGVYDTTTKKWTLGLPTDSHLLLYLFCALLEHPHWMLHVDPTAHPGTQSGNNPLFVACMPQKETFPEKYVAVISGPPHTLHSGACILAVDKQSPPVFALYWEKRLQFALQGRTALWDSILLLCQRIKVAHGGIVRGINLGSSAFDLLSVMDDSISNDDASS